MIFLDQTFGGIYDELLVVDVGDPLPQTVLEEFEGAVEGGGGDADEE